MEETLSDRLTSRKFLMVIGTLCTATLLLWFGKITPEVWDNIVDLLVSVYILGNVVGKSKLINGAAK